MIDFFAHRWNPELGVQTLCHQVQSTPNVKHAFHIAGVVDTPNLFILISRCSSASNKDNLKSGIVSSDRSSYSDDGLLYIYPQRQLFQIFTQSIDAIDVSSVTLSRLNSINAIDVTRCKLMLIESKMFQCSNDPIFNSSTVQMFQ